MRPVGIDLLMELIFVDLLRSRRGGGKKLSELGFVGLKEKWNVGKRE